MFFASLCGPSREPLLVLWRLPVGQTPFNFNLSAGIPVYSRESAPAGQMAKLSHEHPRGKLQDIELF
jgi:hypothetical protein